MTSDHSPNVPAMAPQNPIGAPENRGYRLVPGDPRLSIPDVLEVEGEPDGYDAITMSSRARFALDVFTAEEMAADALECVLAFLPGEWVYREESQRWARAVFELNVNSEVLLLYLRCVRTWLGVVNSIRHFNAPPPVAPCEWPGWSPAPPEVEAQRREHVNGHCADYASAFGNLYTWASDRHVAISVSRHLYACEAWLEFLSVPTAYKAPTFESLLQGDGRLGLPHADLSVFRRCLYADLAWRTPRRVCAREGRLWPNTNLRVGAAIGHLDGTWELRLSALPMDDHLFVRGGGE